MRRQTVAILLLLALTTQAVLGGFRDGVSLCFGGGHEHAPAEVDVTACELACSHESEWPMALSTPGHDDSCGCSDVELSIVDLLTVSRNTGLVDMALPAPLPLTRLSVEPADPGPRLVRRLDPGGDAASHQRLVVVRTTRLLL